MVESTYKASDIKILEGLEAVRKRPAMYIGSTDKSGLHHLVYEVLDNSIDEALAGYCNEIKVIFGADGSCSVEDNGRGIPIDLHPDRGVSAAEIVLTVLHAGGKFEGKGYKVSGGLHGVGVSCVNALSTKLLVDIYRDGKNYKQSFTKGDPDAPGITTDSDKKSTGTTITFFPDNTIFEEVDFEYQVIVSRCKEMAYLNKGIKISLVDNRPEEPLHDDFQFEGGIVSYVQALDANKEPLFKDPYYISKEKDNSAVEVALHYSKNYYDEHVISFVNNIRTKEGGSHVVGFRTALTRSLNLFGKKYKMFKGDEILTGNDTKEGLTAIISIKIQDPQFEGQTKAKLGNSEVRGLVDGIVGEALEMIFERDPSTAREIINKSLLAAKAREAARKAQDLARRKNVLESTTLPGKLADCSEANPELTEIFIVEGDSAGGSAKQGRDRNYQAILPLKGKILNVEKARLDKILENTEIKALITAIGPDVIARLDREESLSREEVLKKVRYHKIIIMTDADVDGAHIRTLLLTFFYRYAREIITEGLMYIAQPPLYLVKKGSSKEYAYNEEQKKEIMSRFNLAGITLYTKNKTQSLQQKDILSFVERLSQLKALLVDSDKRLYKTSDVLNVIFELELPRFLEIKHRVLEAGDLSDIVDDTELFLIKIIQDGELDINKIKDFKHSLDDLNESKNAPYIVDMNGDEKIVESNELLIEFMERVSTKGITIQRYKGLGEMNPEQLWETTLDPSQRAMLQIKLDDAEIADEIFTILMGGDVAPRKNFIETYARKVQWLDI